MILNYLPSELTFLQLPIREINLSQKSFCSTRSVCTTDSDICIQSEHCFDLYKAECHFRLNVGSLKQMLSCVELELGPCLMVSKQN